MVHEIIRLHEYEYLPYERIDTQVINSLEQLTNQRKLPIFRFYRDRLQVRQFVGMVVAEGTNFLLLPKIYNKDDADLTLLVLLLRFTKRLRIHPTGIAELAESNGSFLELWIRHFAEELNRVLRRNPRRAYVDVEEEVGFLRGRLLVEQMRTGREVMTGQYPCRYQVFTTDHLLNQVLAFCNGLLMVQTSIVSTQNILRENAVLLSDVRHRAVGADTIDQIHLNRLNRDYEPVLALCRLLLEKSTLDLRTGRIKQLALVFDMNRLFEEFVATFIKRFASQLGFSGPNLLRRVQSQHFLGKLFGEFAMRVDLLLKDSAGRQILLDTKYKSIDTESKHNGLSQSDFYQMFAYSRAGSRVFDDIVLLFPRTRGIRHTYTSNGTRLHIRELDLKAFVDLEKGVVNTIKAIDVFKQAISIS